MNPRSLVQVLFLLFITATATAIFSYGQQQDQSKVPASQKPQTPKTGEQVFNNNCSRCHTPPMAISPRITGTIVMHMRTRARLSRQDEKLLLQYLAP